MPPLKLPQLPFLTREMLKYGNKTQMRLKLSCAANIVGTVTVRGLTRSGIIELKADTTADGKITTKAQGIDDIPIMLSITDESDTFFPRQCWATVKLELNKQEFATLCSGFVFRLNGPSYPAITQEDPVPGRGFFTTVTGADPAVDTDPSIEVPGGELWRVHYATAQLVTDTGVATRRVHFVVTGAGGDDIRFFQDNGQTASTTRTYNAAAVGWPSSKEHDDFIITPIAPEIWLGTLGTVKFETFLRESGDNWGPIKVRIEKFFGFGVN